MLKTIQKIFFLGAFGLLISATVSGSHSYRFRVYLKDKGNTGYSIDRPEEFLSKEALERRAQRKVAVTSSDIPISESYIDSLSSTGAEPVAQSKWMSTVVMNSPDSLVVDKLKALSFC